MQDGIYRLKGGVTVAALLAILSSAGCKKPSVPPPRGAPDAGVMLPGPPTASLKKKPDLGSPMAGAPDASARGRCLYPPNRDYIKFAELMFKGQHPAAFGQLSSLLRGYPESALLRVRAASVLMRGATTFPSRAQKLYAEALALEKRAGCELSPKFRWLALNGLASTHMDLKDHAAAVPWLRVALKAWPNSAVTRYNLACALCVMGQVDACYQELVVTLNTCASNKPPVVEGVNKPDYHYAKLSQTDPDLARLRADKRYARLVKPYLLANIKTSPPR